jgi:hypothetical protein
MKIEQIAEYEIECAGVLLPDSGRWAAYLTIHGPSANPMHMTSVYPHQRVRSDTDFPTQAEAEEAARNVAMEMIG